VETTETENKEEELALEQRRQIEREQNAEAQSLARAKLAEVFRLVGFKVKPGEKDDSWSAQVRMTGARRDMTLHALANGYRTAGRVRFSVSYPQPKIGEANTYGLADPEATMTLEKSAADLARDVQRRIMPIYEGAMKEVRERNARQELFHATREDNLRMILGQRRLSEYEKRTGQATFNRGDVRISVEAYDRTMDLELRRLPVRLAARFITQIKKGKRRDSR